MPASQAEVPAKLGSLLNRPLDNVQAPQHVATVTEFVKAYTRGNGFDIAGNANDDLAAVIVTASARLLASLSLMPRREIGSNGPGLHAVPGVYPARNGGS